MPRNALSLALVWRECDSLLVGWLARKRALPCGSGCGAKNSRGPRGLGARATRQYARGCVEHDLAAFPPSYEGWVRCPDCGRMHKSKWNEKDGAHVIVS